MATNKNKRGIRKGSVVKKGTGTTKTTNGRSRTRPKT